MCGDVTLDGDKTSHNKIKNYKISDYYRYKSPTFRLFPSFTTHTCILQRKTETLSELVLQTKQGKAPRSKNNLVRQSGTQLTWGLQ